MIRPANARRCWGSSDLTEAKQRGPTGETAPRAGKPPRLSASAGPVHWGLFGVSAKPDKGIGGGPRGPLVRIDGECYTLPLPNVIEATLALPYIFRLKNLG